MLPSQPRSQHTISIRSTPEFVDLTLSDDDNECGGSEEQMPVDVSMTSTNSGRRSVISVGPAAPRWQGARRQRGSTERTDSTGGSGSRTESRTTSRPSFPLERPSTKGRSRSRKLPENRARDSREAAVLKILQPYILEVKRDHSYFVRNALADGRMDAAEIEKYQGNGVGGITGIIYDDEDPFKDMEPIHCTPAEAQTQLTVFRFNPTPTRGTKLYLKGRPIIMPPNLPEVPAYRAMTTLKANIITPDDSVLHYIPYYGESSEEQQEDKNDYEELFSKDGVHISEEDEVGLLYSSFVLDFLNECGLSISAALTYLVGDISALYKYNIEEKKRVEKRRKKCLPLDFDPDEETIKVCKKLMEPVPVEQLIASQVVCKVFREAAKISLWHALKHTEPFVNCDITDNRRSSDGKMVHVQRGPKGPYGLMSYADLACSICYMHHCPFHREDNTSGGVTSGGRRLTRKSSMDDKVHLPMQLEGWPAAAPGAAISPWEDDETCSPGCFIAPSNMRASPNPWTYSEVDLLQQVATVLIRNPRVSCLCASVVNSEIRQWLEECPHLDPVPLNTPINESPDSLPWPPIAPPTSRRRRRWYEEYPSDCYEPVKPKKQDKTANWPQFVPCVHAGPCNESCTCVQEHITCEKTCSCPPSCPRRWRGCSCRRDGKPCSSASNCVCLDAARECDPDLCGTCGAVEVLDPQNRSQYPPQSLCRNVNLQLGISRRTLIGISYVGGMGLYSAEKVPRGGYLGEYSGEVISDEEGVRRHNDAEKRKLSYLFDLNRSQSTDAVRAGNRLRFANHSGQSPNMGVRIMFVNGVHRISFWALKMIYEGDELWFDYAYAPVWIKKFNLREPVLPPRPKTRNRKRKAQGSDDDDDSENDMPNDGGNISSSRMAVKSGNGGSGDGSNGSSRSGSGRIDGTEIAIPTTARRRGRRPLALPAPPPAG